jgi:GNAT superfamily N-acetyltransferase
MPKPQERPFDAGRFVDTNRVRFDPPWAASDIAWWRKRMFEAHGLYPDEYAELLSASSNAIKIVTFVDVDRLQNVVAVKVTGERNDGGFIWLTERQLDLTGRLFEARRMFVDESRQNKRIGRNLMADLVEAAARLNIDTIRIEAEKLGRYVWIRFGFLPDSGSWRALQPEMNWRLSRLVSVLRRDAYLRTLELVNDSNPIAARAIAALATSVPSREVFTESGEPIGVPLGKALLLEHGVGWAGYFDLTNPETMRVYREYIES